MVSYWCSIVNFSLKRTVFEILDFEKCCDLEIQIKGHSRSSEPTQIYSPQYCLLSCIATMGLSRTVSEINGDFSRKSQIFPTPVYFAPLLKGVPLELGAGARDPKN